MRKTYFLSLILLTLFSAPFASGKGKPMPFGPTGILGEMYPGWPKDSVGFKVDRCEKGSPAEGKFKQGDIIVGIGSEKFKIDPRPELAFAIDDAEAAGGKLSLLLDSGKQVTIGLQALGSYSATAPYRCPKTEKVIIQAVEGILRDERIGQSPTRTDLLGLMATGEEKNIAVVTKLIKEGLFDIDPQTVEDILTGEKIDAGPITAGWGWGYILITLGEYHLLTKDDSVLPLMRTYVLGLARGQDASGCWGHRMVTKKLAGRLPGYAQMNQPSLSNFLGMLFARKCGIKDPVLDAAITRTHAYVADHVDKGGFPYGVGGPVAEDFNNNGMSGLAAICMSFQNDQHGAKYFSQLAATSHKTLHQGHANSFFNPLWTPLGAALSGPEVTQQFFKKSLRHFNKKRHWKGGFQGGDKAGNFAGQALLMYCLPRKTLLITGREADQSIWVKGVEATAVVERRSLLDPNKSTEDLIKLLDDPSPQLPANVARILSNRANDYNRTKKVDDITPQLLALIESGNPRQRANAIACFRSRYSPALSAPSLEKIGAILRNKEEPFQVRLAAASALGSGTFKDNAQPYYNDVLELMFDERPASNDPFRHIDTQIGRALDGICTTPFEARLVTNKDLFYKVSVRLMDHNRQKARSAGIGMLSGMPAEDFGRIADRFMVAVKNKNPAYESYHSVKNTVGPGVEVLAHLGIKDGLDVLLDTIMSPGGKWGFKRKMLYRTLPLYGGNAKPYIPKFEAHPNIAKNKKSDKWQKMIKPILYDPKPKPLIGLAEFLEAAAK